MFQTPAVKMIVGLSAFSLAGVLLYIHYKNKDDDEENDELDFKSSKSKNKSNQKNKMKDISLQLILPNDKIPLIVGRGGANLKMIEDKTKTVIRFREKDDNNQFCEIIGKSDNVYKAKDMISVDINRSSTVKEEIFVPQNVCDKIIGCNGATLQEICRKSLAKVSVDSGDRSSGNKTRRVVITGNRSQVNIAKKLVEEKIKEDETSRKEFEEIQLKREPRRSPTNSISSLSSSLTSLTSSYYLPSKEKLSSTINNENRCIDVYVSAMASPAKFWLQLIGPQSKKLDDLVANMTDYYSEIENQNFHKIADPRLGQIVAALYKHDGKWYRAEIVEIKPNEYNPRDVVLDLYFVDYGDSEYVAYHEVFELRTDFLTLRFQAIECYLANVKPLKLVDPSKPDEWDPPSIIKFEELVHVANWKKLKSRIVTYKDRPLHGNHIRREGSPVPGIELFDTIEGTEINIAHMLISHGFASIDFPSHSNDVLRLGDGEDLNCASSYNIQQGDENQSFSTVINEQYEFDNDFGQTHNNILNGSSGNNSYQENNSKKKINLKNNKLETDNFLKSENTNGNSNTARRHTEENKSHLIS